MPLRKIAIQIILFYISITGTAFAGSVPTKGNELILDSAGMFPTSSLPGLEKLAAGPKYSFYVVTIDSFNGAIPGDYSKDIYLHWKLRADDIIILISKEDRRIQFYFENPDLQLKIDSLPSNYAGSGYEGRSMIDQFVGKHFTPNAKQGNFAQGIEQLINATNNLSEPEASVQNGKPLLSEQASDAPASANEPIVNRSLLFNIIMAALTLLVIFYLIARLISLKRFTERKQRMNETAKVIAVGIVRDKESLELLLNLYHGPSADTKLKLVDSELDVLAIHVHGMLDSISRIRMQFIGNSGSAALEEAEDVIRIYNGEYNKLNSRAKFLVSLDKKTGLWFQTCYGGLTR